MDIITLGMPDLAAARRFYLDGLGWEPILEIPGDIIFVQVGHGVVLALWRADELERDIDPKAPAPATSGSMPFTLAHNVDSDAEVSEVLAKAERAGGTVLKPARRNQVGFVHGYFADPAGFRWEVAHNPGWMINPDGTVQIGSTPD